MNIHNDSKQVDSKWLDLCMIMDPLKDVLSTIHLFLDIGTCQTHGESAHWQRIDHFFGNLIVFSD